MNPLERLEERVLGVLDGLIEDVKAEPIAGTDLGPVAHAIVDKVLEQVDAIPQDLAAIRTQAEWLRRFIRSKKDDLDAETRSLLGEILELADEAIITAQDAALREIGRLTIARSLSTAAFLSSRTCGTTCNKECETCQHREALRLVGQAAAEALWEAVEPAIKAGITGDES